MLRLRLRLRQERWNDDPAIPAWLPPLNVSGEAELPNLDISRPRPVISTLQSHKLSSHATYESAGAVRAAPHYVNLKELISSVPNTELRWGRKYGRMITLRSFNTRRQSQAQAFLNEMRREFSPRKCSKVSKDTL